MPTKDDWDVQTETHRRERVFRQRSDSFIRSNDLELHPHYDTERQGINGDGLAPHIYPDSNHEVKYMTRNERGQTVRHMENGQLTDTNIVSLDGQRQVGQIPHRWAMFTRRGSVDDLMLMQKHAVIQEQGNAHPLLKSNHSTFSQGENVANAGFLEFKANNTLNRVILSSGHYGPNHASAVKLSMWADRNRAFAPDVPIEDHNERPFNVSHQERVEVVNAWATAHPLPQVRRRGSF